MIRIDGNSVYLKTDYSQRLRCASIPGGLWDPKAVAWRYPFTAGAMLNLRNLVNQMPRESQYMIDGINEAHLALQRDGTGIPVFKTPPWNHQAKAFHFVKNIMGLDTHRQGGGALLALDMGTGKSKVAVDLIQNFQQEIKNVLIVCPHAVIKVWPKQFELHSRYTPKVVALEKGSVANRTKQAELALRTNADGQTAIIINYESFWREPFSSHIERGGYDLLVLDEVHRIKSAGGKASRFGGRVGRDIKYRLGLSGTPMPHSPLDVYGSYRTLDPGIFGTSFQRFQNEYAIMSQYNRHQVVAFKNLDKLHQLFYLIAYHVKSEDVLDLPEFRDEVITFDLQSEEKAYESMAEELWAEVNDEIVTASNALVKFLRLQEITSGYLEGKELGQTKREILSDLLEDFPATEPIVVFYRFRNDAKAIREVAKKANRRYGEVSGDINQVSEFQAGEVDLLGVQIQSGKEGIDLTRARYAIYYSLTFSLGDYMQSRKRLHRPGQKNNVVYYHLVADKTIDAYIMKALKAKDEVVQSVLSQIKQGGFE